MKWHSPHHFPLSPLLPVTQHLRTSPSPARSPAAGPGSPYVSPMSPRGDAAVPPAAWAAYGAALRRIQEGVEDLVRASASPSIAVFDPGNAPVWQRTCVVV